MKSRPPLSVRWAEHLYGVTLFLYPPSYAREWGADMVECFRDAAWDAWRRRGWTGVLVAWLRTCAELPSSAARAHLQAMGLRRGPGRARAQPGEYRSTGERWSMDGWRQDFGFALRSIRSRPLVSTLAVLSLGIGIAATLTMMSMVRDVLRPPLPVQQPERLVRVFQVDGSPTNLSWPNYRDIVDRTESVFDGVLVQTLATVAMADDERSEVVHGELVSSNYFELLGIPPQLGVFFNSADHEAPESPPVVVLSHHLWSTRYGGDASVVGQLLRINGHPTLVVGVAPPEFTGTKWGLGMDFWLPIRQRGFLEGWDSWETRRGNRWLTAVARLSREATREQANRALDVIAGQLRQEHPDANARLGLLALPEAGSRIDGSAYGMLRVIQVAALGVGLLVLLVSCANVSGMLLARAVGRRHEVGVRYALGAGRLRIVRLMMAESFVFALLGGALGFGCAAVVGMLAEGIGPRIPYRLAFDLSPDLGTLTLVSAVSLLAGLILGLPPSLQAARSGPAGALRADALDPGRRGGLLLNGIVVGMVALSFVTLAVGGLFTRSLGSVRALDAGLGTENRLIVAVDPSLVGTYETAERQTDFLRAVEERLMAAPGVERVAFASHLPLGDRQTTTRFYADERTYQADHPGVEIWRSRVTPSFLDLVGIGLLAGRGFLEADGDSAAPARMIINEAAAIALWPGGDPVGRRVRFTPEPGDGPVFEVIGVVPTAKYSFMSEDPRPAAYTPLYNRWAGRSELVVATRGEPLALADDVRGIVRAVDPDVPVFDVRDLRGHMEFAEWLFRLGAGIGLSLGALAVLLAAGGLYGVVAFAVGRRTREIGLRMALGAPRRVVLAMILTRSARVTLWGVGIGLALALATGGVLSALLVGVGGRDPVTLVSVGLVLLGIGVVAALGPARTATLVDPVATLREE